MALSTLTAKRCIHQGLLQKRCRLSWRPRHVEVISDPTDMAGHLYSFQLLIYDPRKRILKDRIRMESIVTIRASRDCYFQIFLSSGKILQFKTETIASQAHWIAMLKMGLGKGNIFHVFLNTVNEMEHALLFSVGVNLPPHRTGQLDRVLVLASPINDINIYAWDLNRVTRFVELDIGIRMELCASCVRGQTTTLTFVIEKQFVKDCMSFLRKEAHISGAPVDDHGLLIHSVNHQCCFNTPPTDDAPPPPYMEAPPLPIKQRVTVNNAGLAPNGRVQVCNINSTSDNGTDAVEFPAHSQSEPHPLSVSKTQPVLKDFSSQHGSLTSELPFQAHNEDVSDAMNYKSDLPPRTIPRPNYESAIPAEAHPYLQYQPHLYSSSGNRCFEPPYHLSSRIVITDSGEIQFERNVMGSLPQNRFHYNGEMPLPPRGHKLESNTEMLHTRVTLEAKCGPHNTFNGSINVDDDEHSDNNTPKTRRWLSRMNSFETREYVNFPVSVTPPPTAKHFGRYTHGLNRTSSDSELNYANRSTAEKTVVGTPGVKRASQVSVTSDIYIIPRSPLPGHLPFISSTNELSYKDDNPGINPPFKFEDDETDYVKMHSCGVVSGILVDSWPASYSSTPNEPSGYQDEVEKPQSPIPIPRRKPTVTPRKKIMQNSKSLEPQNSRSKDDSYLGQQKPPVPRPRTKTSVQLSVNVSLGISETFNCGESGNTIIEETDNPVELHSNSGFYVDEDGVGVSDV